MEFFYDLCIKNLREIFLLRFKSVKLRLKSRKSREFKKPKIVLSICEVKYSNLAYTYFLYIKNLYVSSSDYIYL
jgi:hypothetical protein